MDLLEHNRLAWNKEVANGNVWTVPVTKSEVYEARNGRLTIFLTPKTPVPKGWLGDLEGQRVLCLASGGGQQGPLLAAAGARVTVFDNSDEQLKRDQDVAKEFGLDIRTVRGNMQDLGCLADGSFDLIVHPVSNCFIDDILPVWRECYRVLDKQGSLISGFNNPIIYMIDLDNIEKTGRCEITNAIPYSDLRSLSPKKKQEYVRDCRPFEFGHSLGDQIQGQILAGFLIAGFYEDRGEPLLDPYTCTYIATRAIKQ